MNASKRTRYETIDFGGDVVFDFFGCVAMVNDIVVVTADADDNDNDEVEVDVVVGVGVDDDAVLVRLGTLTVDLIMAKLDATEAVPTTSS